MKHRSTFGRMWLLVVMILLSALPQQSSTTYALPAHPTDTPNQHVTAPTALLPFQHCTDWSYAMGLAE